MATTFWLAEAPKRPGIYARDPAHMTVDGWPLSTRNVDEALKFETHEACAKWCAENPDPLFAPVEHSEG
jgi:hypothetical protein